MTALLHVRPAVRVTVGCGLVLGALLRSMPAAAQEALPAPTPATEGADATGATDSSPEEIAVATDAPPSEPVPPPPEAATAEAPAAPPFPLGVTASVFTRPELRAGYDRIGQADTDFVRYRFRLGLALTPVDLGRVRVGGRFVPQAAGFWSSGGTLTDPALGIHEAVLLLGTDHLDVEVGRFEMSYGEELVIGPVGWHQVGRAFDGARLHAKLGSDGAFLDVFGTQLVENLDTNFAAGDVIFMGAYAGLGPLLGETLQLDVYALELLLAENPDPDPTLSTPRRHVTTLGSRVVHRGDTLDLRAEVGVQISGSDGGDPLIGYQADVEVGARLGRVRLSAEALIASGANGDNVAAWNQLFPTAHKFLGVADIMGGRSNVISGILHGRVSLTDSAWASLDVHLFARPEAAERFQGAEADLGVGWTIGRGLTLRGNYSIFVPAEDAFSTREPAHFAELELRYTLSGR
ncbi:MAG: alginate export family protein [Polyangiales bacterium]|nr:alginate export family protein [Myxococcales bacterium]MCB9660599.1 alginate export family protein [Sandaracinaceae bacterium]